jgi:hypothetical protein
MRGARSKAAEYLLGLIERDEAAFKAFLTEDERARYEAWAKEGATLINGIDLAFSASGNLAVAAAGMVAQSLPQWTRERDQWTEMRRLYESREKVPT